MHGAAQTLDGATRVSHAPILETSIPDYPDRPIGIFDFGVGGLTVMREIVKAIPSESLVFLNDNVNLAAGNKSDDAVVSDSLAVSKFLQRFNPKALVVACNTATAVALKRLRAEHSFPVIGVIEPTARRAVAATKTGKIGVIGTRMTIRSEAYPSLIRELKPSLEVLSQACPLLVPMIEDEHTTHEALRRVAADYLKIFIGKGIDSVILGRTHYPLIRPLLADLLLGVNLIDPASPTANELKNVLLSMNLLAGSRQPSKYVFYATDLNQQSDSIVKRVFSDHPLEQKIEWQHASL